MTAREPRPAFASTPAVTSRITPSRSLRIRPSAANPSRRLAIRCTICRPAIMG